MYPLFFANLISLLEVYGVGVMCSVFFLVEKSMGSSWGGEGALLTIVSSPLLKTCSLGTSRLIGPSG